MKRCSSLTKSVILWRNIQLGKDRVIKENVRLVLIKVPLNWYFLNRAHLCRQTPSQLCDGDIDEVGVVDHLILDSCLHAKQTVLQIVTYCCNCQCMAELFIFARTVHIHNIQEKTWLSLSPSVTGITPIHPVDGKHRHINRFHLPPWTYTQGKEVTISM